jgi:nucleotide-binding universal stress UspA family protein
MAHWSQVLVGVDGSEGSRRALAWAAEQAREHSAVLRVLGSWSTPLPPVGVGDSGYPWTGSVDRQEYTEKLVAEAVTAVLGENPGPTVRQEVVEGHAAEVLIVASSDADLVVVGCRGYGGFTGMLLGSVSQHVAAHANCPVTVVR